MKLRTLILVLMLGLLPLSVLGASAAQQKQFADNYRKALEAKDEKALHALLYAKDSDPEALDMYKLLMTMGLDKPIESVEVHELTDEDRKDIAELTDMKMKPIKYNIEPVAKLEIVRGGASKRTDRVFLAEHGGKLVIPVPRKAK